MPRLRLYIQKFLRWTFKFLISILDLESLERQDSKRSNSSDRSSERLHSGISQRKHNSGRKADNRESDRHRSMFGRAAYGRDRVGNEQTVACHSYATPRRDKAWLDQTDSRADEHKARSRPTAREDESHRSKYPRAARYRQDLHEQAGLLGYHNARESRLTRDHRPCQPTNGRSQPSYITQSYHSHGHSHPTRENSLSRQAGAGSYIDHNNRGRARSKEQDPHQPPRSISSIQSKWTGATHPTLYTIRRQTHGDHQHSMAPSKHVRFAHPEAVVIPF